MPCARRSQPCRAPRSACSTPSCASCSRKDRRSAAIRGRLGLQIEGSLFDELLPSPPEGLREAYEAALAGRRTEVDVRGESSIWEVHTAPVLDADGVVIAGVSITLDVTEERYLAAAHESQGRAGRPRSPR